MKHAEEHLDLQDADLDTGLVSQDGGESGQGFPRGGIHLLHVAEFEMRIEADENGGETDEGMQRRNELRHLRHLHLHRDLPTDDGCDREHDEDEPEIAAARPDTVGNTASAMPTIPYQTARLALS